MVQFPTKLQKPNINLTPDYTINKPKTLKILPTIRNLARHSTIANASRIFEKAKLRASNTYSTPNPLRSTLEVTRDDNTYCHVLDLRTK